jgi:aspartate aminotransferase-like enzyme
MSCNHREDSRRCFSAGPIETSPEGVQAMTESEIGLRPPDFDDVLRVVIEFLYE